MQDLRRVAKRTVLASHDGDGCHRGANTTENDAVIGRAAGGSPCENGGPTQVSAVLYVARGSLRDEYARCRRDPLFHGGSELYTTWSAVSTHLLDPIAAYLYQQLRPLWGEVVPSVSPVAVNLPLSA